jgi:hypothetical protein
MSCYVSTSPASEAPPGLNSGCLRPTRRRFLSHAENLASNCSAAIILVRLLRGRDATLGTPKPTARRRIFRCSPLQQDVAQIKHIVYVISIPSQLRHLLNETPITTSITVAFTPVLVAEGVIELPTFRFLARFYPIDFASLKCDS